MNSKNRNSKAWRCLDSFVHTLHELGGEARLWLTHWLVGVPVFNLGRFEATKSDLANIDRRWNELFLLPSSIESVLYVWPGFAFLSVTKHGRDLVVRAVLIEKNAFRFCPMQAHFHRAKRTVSYSPWALGGATDSTFGTDEGTKGWLPDLYLRAIDAERALLVGLKPGESWDRFSCIVQRVAARAA